MQQKITYLLGAGASCAVVPMVAQMEKNINELYTKIDEFVTSNSSRMIIGSIISGDANGTQIDEKLDLLKKFSTDLKKLEQICNTHASIDTYAKKLFIQNSHEYDELKKLLTYYFLIVQYSQDKTDPRYDNFFASLIDSESKKLPPFLNILSWNYDCQFELSFSSFFNQLYPDKSNIYLNNGTKNINRNIFIGESAILKLNGTCAFYAKSEEEAHFPDILESVEVKSEKFLIEVLKNLTSETSSRSLIESILHVFNYYKSYHNAPPLLSFAWEKERSDANLTIIEKSIQATNETSILVVIGYTFPYFNREVDREIIRSMTGLKKVYFQAPNAEDLILSFKAIRDDIDDKNLIPITDCKLFYLPKEM